MMIAANEKLRTAGWELAHVFRMVALPDERGDEELILWRSPTGEVLAEQQALERLAQEEDDG